MAPQQRRSARQQQQQQRQAAAQQPGDGEPQQELSTTDKLVFYTAQHIGLVLCVLGIGLLALGYDKGWMDNARLCLLSLGLCLVGLLFHEFRPFSAQAVMEAEMAAKASQ